MMYVCACVRTCMLVCMYVCVCVYVPPCGLFYLPHLVSILHRSIQGCPVRFYGSKGSLKCVKVCEIELLTEPRTE